MASKLLLAALLLTPILGRTLPQEARSAVVLNERTLVRNCSLYIRDICAAWCHVPVWRRVLEENLRKKRDTTIGRMKSSRLTNNT